MSHEAKRILAEHESHDAKNRSLEARLDANQKVITDMIDTIVLLTDIFKKK